jgi:hypothetical protein
VVDDYAVGDGVEVFELLERGQAFDLTRGDDARHQVQGIPRQVKTAPFLSRSLWLWPVMPMCRIPIRVDLKQGRRSRGAPERKSALQGFQDPGQPIGMIVVTVGEIHGETDPGTCP